MWSICSSIQTRKMKSTDEQGECLDSRMFPSIECKSIDTCGLLSRTESFLSVRDPGFIGFKGLKIVKMSKCELDNIDAAMARRLVKGH